MRSSDCSFLTSSLYVVGVSYVLIFIVAYHIVFWMGGAAHSISWDYRPGVPQGEAAEVRVSWKEKPVGSLIARYILREEVPNSFSRSHTNTIREKDDVEKSVSVKEKSVVAESAAQSIVVSEVPSQPEHSANSSDGVQYLSASAAPSAVPPVPPPSPAISIRNVETQSITQRSATLNPPTLLQKIWRIVRPLKAIVTPVTCTLAVSLPIALIQPLKALFVDVSATGGPHYAGPDGRPPLAFLIDTGMPSPSRHLRSAAG